MVAKVLTPRLYQARTPTPTPTEGALSFVLEVLSPGEGLAEGERRNQWLPTVPQPSSTLPDSTFHLLPSVLPSSSSLLPPCFFLLLFLFAFLSTSPLTSSQFPYLYFLLFSISSSPRSLPLPLLHPYSPPFPPFPPLSSLLSPIHPHSPPLFFLPFPSALLRVGAQGEGIALARCLSHTTSFTSQPQKDPHGREVSPAVQGGDPETRESRRKERGTSELECGTS